MPAPMWKPIELQELQQLIGDSERAMNVPEAVCGNSFEFLPQNGSSILGAMKAEVSGLSDSLAIVRSGTTTLNLALMPPATINSERSPTTSAIKSSPPRRICG